MRYPLSVAAMVTTLLITAPSMAVAQTSPEPDELRTAIQASVLSDPRVADIPPTQLNSLIDALVQQAQSQKMSASDILWQPGRAEAATIGSGAVAESCPGGIEGYTCQFNKVFGFEGGNYEIPLFLLIVSGLLIAVIWEIHAHHKKNMMKMAKKTPVATPPQKLVQ